MTLEYCVNIKSVIYFKQTYLIQKIKVNVTNFSVICYSYTRYQNTLMQTT